MATSSTPHRNVTGTLSVFGHEDTEAHLRLLPRSTGWRATRAGAFTLGGVALAPLVALVPPHAAWALASVGTGVALGIRKWKERFTLLRLRAPCPRCGQEIRRDSPARLRTPETVTCEACHHSASLVVDPEALRPQR